MDTMTTAENLTAERAKSIVKGKILNWNLWEQQLMDRQNVVHFKRCLDVSNLLTFLTAEPALYRPARVIDFCLNARIADDGKSFSTKVFNTEITVSPQ